MLLLTCFCRSKLKTLASLAELKVTDYLYGIKFLCQYSLHKAESISVNAIGAATDLLIAVILCILLGLSRTGFKK